MWLHTSLAGTTSCSQNKFFIGMCVCLAAPCHLDGPPTWDRILQSLTTFRMQCWLQHCTSGTVNVQCFKQCSSAHICEMDVRHSSFPALAYLKEALFESLLIISTVKDTSPSQSMCGNALSHVTPGLQNEQTLDVLEWSCLNTSTELQCLVSHCTEHDQSSRTAKQLMRDSM